MINTFIALLVLKGELTEAEGESLAEKIRNATLPADYRSAMKQVQKFLDQIERGE